MKWLMKIFSLLCIWGSVMVYADGKSPATQDSDRLHVKARQTTKTEAWGVLNVTESENKKALEIIAEGKKKACKIDELSKRVGQAVSRADELSLSAAIAALQAELDEINTRYVVLCIRATLKNSSPITDAKRSALLKCIAMFGTYICSDAFKVVKNAVVNDQAQCKVIEELHTLIMEDFAACSPAVASSSSHVSPVKKG